MTINQMMQTIDRVVQSNRLRVHSDFNAAFIERQGFFSEVEPLAQTAVQSIFERCVYGVNAGFRTSADDIAELSAIVVQLTKLKNDDLKKRQKLQGQVNKIMKSNGSFKINHPARDDLNKTCDTTARAIDTVLGNEEIFGTLSLQQRAYLETIREKVGVLKAALEPVGDYESAAALEHARRIMLDLLDVRRHLLNAFVAGPDVRSMDDAISHATDWGLLTGPVRSKDRAKGEFPHYFEDGVGNLAEAQQSLTDFVLFRERLTAEEEKLRKILSRTEDGVGELNAKLEAYKTEVQQVFAEVDNNGDTMELKRRRRELSEAIKQTQSELQLQTSELERQKKNLEVRRRILVEYRTKLLNPLQTEIDSRPAYAGRLIGKLNFGDVVGVLNGDYRQSNADSAIEALVRVRNEAARVDSEARAYMNLLGDVNDVQAEKMKDALDLLGIEEQEKISAKISDPYEDAEDDDLLRSFANVDKLTDDSQKKGRNTNGKRPLSSDDN